MCVLSVCRIQGVFVFIMNWCELLISQWHVHKCVCVCFFVGVRSRVCLCMSKSKEVCVENRIEFIPKAFVRRCMWRGPCPSEGDIVYI